MNIRSDKATPPIAEHVLVEPMSIHIGAQISGVDLTKALEQTEVNAIRQALLQWKVIFFRDQHLDHRQHIEFARNFGDITPAHAVFGCDPEFPEIYPVTKAGENVTRPMIDSVRLRITIGEIVGAGSNCG